MVTAPILCEWTGESFVPASGFWARKADAAYVVHEKYQMVEQNERSTATHNHFFAVVAEAWKNLPERYTDASWAQSPEHLRKYALIRKGYSNSQTLVCSSRAEAMRVAAFLRPIDEFAVVTVNEAAVTRYTAKSQSRKAMGKEVFQESKQAVLDYLDDLLTLPRGTLQKEGKAA